MDRPGDTLPQSVTVHFALTDFEALAKAFRRRVGAEDRAYANRQIHKARSGDGEALAFMVAETLRPRYPGYGKIGLMG